MFNLSKNKFLFFLTLILQFNLLLPMENDDVPTSQDNNYLRVEYSLYTENPYAAWNNFFSSPIWQSDKSTSQSNPDDLIPQDPNKLDHFRKNYFSKFDEASTQLRQTIGQDIWSVWFQLTGLSTRDLLDMRALWQYPGFRLALQRRPDYEAAVLQLNPEGRAGHCFDKVDGWNNGELRKFISEIQNDILKKYRFYENEPKKDVLDRIVTTNLTRKWRGKIKFDDVSKDLSETAKTILQNLSPRFIRQISSSGNTDVYKCNIRTNGKTTTETGEILITVKNTRYGPEITNVEVKLKEVKEITPNPTATPINQNTAPIIMDSILPDSSSSSSSSIVDSSTGMEGWQYTGRDSEKISIDIGRIDKQIIRLKEAYQSTTLAIDVDNFSLVIKNFNNLADDFNKNGQKQEAEAFLNIAKSALTFAGTTLQSGVKGVYGGAKNVGTGTIDFAANAWNNPSGMLLEQTKKLSVLCAFVVLASNFPVVGTVGAASYAFSLGYEVGKNFATKPYAQALEDSTKLLTENAIHNIIATKGVEAFVKIKKQCLTKIAQLFQENKELEKDTEKILSKAFRETPLFKKFAQDLKETIYSKNSKDHIFQPDHKKNGIYLFAKSQTTEEQMQIEILKNLENKFLTLFEQGLLKEGYNRITTQINGKNAEYKIYMQNGKPLSIDLYPGHSDRISKSNHLIENPDGTFKPHEEGTVKEEAKTAAADNDDDVEGEKSILQTIGEHLKKIGQKIIGATVRAAPVIAYKALKKASGDVGSKIAEDLVFGKDSQPATTSSSLTPTPIDPRDQAISPCDHLSRNPFDGYQSPCDRFSSSPIDMFSREPFGMHRQSSTSSAFVQQTPHHLPYFFDDFRRKGKRSFSEREDESATSDTTNTSASGLNTSIPFNPNDFFDFTSSSTTTTSSTHSSAPTTFDPNNLF